MTDRPVPETQPSPAADVEAKSASRWTRLAATLVLVPTIPMMLASIAALALFYVAPARLDRLLARLPGEELLRTILFFAPATLFAIVVLALLYALEQPAAARPVQPVARRPTTASGILLVSTPLLLLSFTAWVARFLAPGRFSNLLEPLPGTVYLQRLVTFAPPVLLLVTLSALLFRRQRSIRSAAAEAPPAGWAPVANGWARAGAGLILLPTLPLLLASLAALALYSFSPERLEDLLTRLSQPTVVRLGLIFAPAALTAIVLLAGLYLFFSPGAASSRGAAPPSAVSTQPGQVRQAVAAGVLVLGLAASSLIAVGLIGALTWLMLR